LIKDDPYNNPLASLYISVSQPCGILTQKYFKRNESLSDFLNIDNDECKYEGPLGKAHEMYQKAGQGWSLNEYEALRINNKLN
jgi:hypothetical protein